MGDSADETEDVATLRMRLEEAQSRIESLRRQQAEAKSKAKAVIQKQRAQARDQIEALENEKKCQAEELSLVKDLLRDSDAARNRLNQEKEALQMLVDRGKEDMQRIVVEREELEGKYLIVEKDKDRMAEKFASEGKELRQQIADLEGKLVTNSEKSEREAHDVSASVVEAQNAELVMELKSANERTADLEETCKQLREEVDSLKKANTDQTGGGGEGGSGELSAVTAELHDAREKAGRLSREMEEMRERMSKMESDHEESMRSARSKQIEAENSLSESEKRMLELRADLEKSEIALQQERTAVANAEKRISESANNEESKIILEAKIAEMERLVASKQADIVKVREKAKTYLKDINAEKREVEEKMKKEVEELRKEIEVEQEKVKLAEQRAESSSAELDNCLALIRDKQKNIQMLKMSVASEQKATEQARDDIKALQTEFAAYKERARIALQEKEKSSSGSEEAVESATKTIRGELDKTRKEVAQLRRQLVGMKDMEIMLQEATERAEKAEAAADLLRSDSNVHNANYNQIDFLEEKVSTLENEIRMARSTVEDAEAQHQTTKMRLEAAERALRATELRAEESERQSGRTAEGLKKRICDLETELAKAHESSAAAQRTAALAAKALAFNGTIEIEETTTRPEGNHLPPTECRTVADSEITGDSSPYNSAASMGSGRSTFAAAMEGHSESLGLGRYSTDGIPNGQGDVSNDDLIARDKQIRVLSAQVAELGALLDEAQQETSLKSEQTDLLKAEVKSLDAKLAAAEKLKNGAPFSYLRTIVVRYLETDDATLLPVIANVLGFSDDESSRVKAHRGSAATPAAKLSGSSPGSSYFSIPFLGPR